METPFKIEWHRRDIINFQKRSAEWYAHARALHVIKGQSPDGDYIP
jgi:hypothetical protein